MFIDSNIENLFNSSFDGLYPWITELYHFPGIGKDDVVMLSVKVRFLVLRLVLTELMFSDQSGIYQQVDGVIQGSSTYTIVLVLHDDVKRLDIKMFITIIYLM